MINQSDAVKHEEIGFDGAKYIQLQTAQIEERRSKFPGRLYLEIGGKFMFDAHASRVLPGFDPESKKRIFSSFKDQAEILFCIDAKDIVSNRQLSNESISYEEYVMRMLQKIESWIGIKPQIVINKIDKKKMADKVKIFQKSLKKAWYQVWKRYFIQGYPDMDIVLSNKGYGQDEYIKLEKNLVLVTGAASNSGKMSTCLGQIYLDDKNDVRSGYAKYETFPIWNLSVDHPVNLAYEAATADIGDSNCLDNYHMEAYGQESVNYNRDVEAFEIVMGIAQKIVNHKNYMRTYKSPTDMWISNAGFAIVDDEVVARAGLEEIRRRKIRYQQMVDRGDGEQVWVERCEKLEEMCLEYIGEKGV